jgi:hypothetical protein
MMPFMPLALSFMQQSWPGKESGFDGTIFVVDTVMVLVGFAES